MNCDPAGSGSHRFRTGSAGLQAWRLVGEQLGVNDDSVRNWLKWARRCKGSPGREQRSGGTELSDPEVRTRS